MADKFHILGQNKRPVEETGPKKRKRPGAAAGRCTVCGHRDRVLIELQMANGGSSLRGLARQFELSYKAIENHHKNHVSAERLARLRLINPLSKADVLSDLSAEAGKSALENLRAIHAGVVSMWLNALHAGHLTTISAPHRPAHNAIVHLDDLRRLAAVRTALVRRPVLPAFNFRKRW